MKRFIIKNKIWEVISKIGLSVTIKDEVGNQITMSENTWNNLKKEVIENGKN